MVIERLETEQVTAYFDTDTSIAYIIYSGELGAAESEAAYGWLQKLIDTIGTESLCGEVFDFRQVKFFTTENLIDARKNSRKMNIMANTHHFPVAMIVANAMHEEILRGPMRNVQENQRKTIVRTTEEALNFLTEWNLKNGRNL